VRSLAIRERPKLIVCGGSSLPRKVDFQAFSEIAQEVGAICVADIAHVAGLVAGGVYPSPFPSVDVVTTTTHKTLRGPRGAIVMCKSSYRQRIDHAVFPGLQGAAHNHTTAAIAVTLHEAALDSFKDYAKRVVASARRLARELSDRGLDVVTGGTDTHMILLDARRLGLTGRELAARLSKAGIETNANALPFDARNPDRWSGVRLGTAAITTRGVPLSDMPKIAEWVSRAALTPDDEALDSIHADIVDYLGQHEVRASVLPVRESLVQ
jgi:glycine hydroxymethyltransferase